MCSALLCVWPGAGPREPISLEGTGTAASRLLKKRTLGERFTKAAACRRRSRFFVHPT